jgi:hypothetical protein
MAEILLNLPKYIYTDVDSNVELVPVSELVKFREYNRLIDAKYSKKDSAENINKLKEVYKTEGITSVLIIEYSVEDNSVLLIEGNHRLNAALELGIRYLPARVVRRNSSFPKMQKAKAMEVSGVLPNEYGYIRGDLKPSEVGINGTKRIVKGDESVFSEGGTILLAPNGNPSNLNETQWHLVRSPEFIAWFGNWIDSPETASKMLDDNGEPLVCYHGTNREFNVFRSDVGSTHDLGFYGRGFYFTFNPESNWMKFAKGEASYYGSLVKDYFIKIVNPFDFSELSEYKGVKINYMGTESIVFLSNIAIKFPELSDKIKVQQVKWNKETQENDVNYIPISVLPELIEKYSKMLNTFETEDNFGEKNKITGYVKSELVEYDYTSSGGTKGSYESIDRLGIYDKKIKKEELEILLVVDAIEKYDRIEAKYQPEGYMTRFPEITDLIKKEHDGIVQSKFGDEVVVFEPTQIKLADGSNVNFDGNNPDVRFELGGSLEKITETENFKKWFGNSVFVVDKYIWDDDKYLTVKTPKIFYHETLSDNLKKIEEDGFDISLASSRKGDNLMPDGIFLKDNYKEIGVGGRGEKVQIPVYVSAEKVKYFETRNDLYNYLKDNKDFYDKYWESEVYDKEMNANYQEQFNYNKYFEGYERGTDEEKKRLDLFRSETDKFLNEWQSENYRLAEESRKNVTDILKSEGLDAIVVRNDEGSFGRKVYTLVVFNPNNVKSSVNNLGTFDKNRSGIIYNDGGSVSFDKLISASSRFKPTETVVFHPPLEGKNGAKLTSYVWAYEMDMQPNKEGELVGKRVSDWTQAEISAETGRGIVHQYTIELPNGDVKTVSSETVPVLLGYIDKSQAKVFGNIATASKTLAKQQMKLAIMEAQKIEYDELYDKFDKEKKPEIRIATFEELPFVVKKQYEEGYTPSSYFVMQDVMASQYNDDYYDSKEGKTKFIIKDKPNNQTIESLNRDWILKRIKEAGVEYPRGLYDLKNRVERQKRKVENMLKSDKMENGGSTDLSINARKVQLRNKLSDVIKNLDYKTVDIHTGKSKEDLFIQRVVDMIYDGYDFKSKLDIERIATKEFGFDDSKKVRELTEYAILFVGRDISKEHDVKSTYDKLVSLYANQPYSTNRTAKSQELGQFSTPAPMAYLMGIYVGIDKRNDSWIKDDTDVEQRYNHYKLQINETIYKITEYLIKDKPVKLKVMSGYKNFENEKYYSIDSVKEFDSVDEAKEYVSSILENKIYIEPTAGNGMLSIAGNPNDFVVNELDFNRYNNLLKDNYKQVLNQDATKPFNFDYKFDGLLANPPFATTKIDKIIDNFKISGLENQIIINSLAHLKDDAKGAFIVGGHTEYDSVGRLKSAKDKAFLSYLYSRYNVEDVINISGMLYGRQGTTYPIRIILFNGRKQVPSGYFPLKDDNISLYEPFSPKIINNFGELYNRFEKTLLNNR